MQSPGLGPASIGTASIGTTPNDTEPIGAASDDIGPDGPAPRSLRVAAYAVCVRDGDLLLARFSPGDPAGVRWTLPGGGLDHGEHPEQGAIREVREETGYDVELTGLLGIDSIHYQQRDGTDFHGLRVLYSARVVGGALCHEIGGSTDLAAWIPLDSVPELDRIGLVDIALDLARAAGGRSR